MDVVNPFRFAGPVHDQMTDYGITHQREFPGTRCRRKRDRRTVEVRGCVTAPLALVAIMASGTPAMWNRQVRDSVRHHAPAEFLFNDLFGQPSSARQFHRWQELTVGHLSQPLSRSAHPNEAFHAIVIRLHFFVADGPVFAISIAAGGLKLIVTEAVALPRPTESLSPDLPATNPHERLVQRERVRMLQVVYEELMAVLVAGIAQALHRLSL